MSSARKREGRFHGLDLIRTDLIDPNAENPRLEFPQEELDRLSESIDKEGILVPLVVYPESNRYVLVDGERRLRCALELGIEEVPAVITEKTSKKDNLLQMFNIHLIREQWQDIPTAIALGKLMKETGQSADRDLSDLTGLSTERIKRLKHALELPAEYQAYIRDGSIPLNWFWELKRSVIDPMAKNRPTIFASYGQSGVTAAFVNKRLAGQATDSVALRDVRPILTLAAKDAGAAEAPSVLDETIRRLVEDTELSISQAYEDTVQIVVEADKLEGRTVNMLKSFQRLLDQVRSEDERHMVIEIGRRFIKQLADLIKPSQ